MGKAHEFPLDCHSLPLLLLLWQPGPLGQGSMVGEGLVKPLLTQQHQGLGSIMLSAWWQKGACIGIQQQGCSLHCLCGGGTVLAIHLGGGGPGEPMWYMTYAVCSPGAYDQCSVQPWGSTHSLTAHKLDSLDLLHKFLFAKSVLYINNMECIQCRRQSSYKWCREGLST